MEDRGAGDAIGDAQKIISGAKSRERVLREEDQQVAQNILNSMGQGDVPKRLWAYYKGEDVINRLEGFFRDPPKPLTDQEVKEKERKDVDSIISGLTEYIPFREEILDLVRTAMAGPVTKAPDGTFISFHLSKKALKMSGIAAGGGIKTSEQVTDFEATNSMATKIMSAFSDTQNSENGKIVLLNPPRTLKMTVGAVGKRDSSEKPYMRTVDVKRF